MSARVTLDEVRNLLHFVKEKTGDVTHTTGTDEIDLSDLINAMMDVSVDMMGDEKPVLNETAQTGASNRYSADNNTKKQPMVARDEYLQVQQ